MNIDQDRQMLMVDDNVGNQFREIAMQNVRHLVRQNAVQNQDTQNVRNQNGLSVISGIANQHGSRNVIAARAEGNSNEINGNQISRGARLLVMKCLHSPEYMTALGGAIGRAIEKSMQDGLAAGIDHGQAGRVLAVVTAYDPSAEANYLAAINDLRSLEDQVVIREISLSDSLEVAHNHVQRLKGDATVYRLSFTEVALSVRSLTGEVSTSEVPTVTTAVTTEQEKQDVAPEHAPVS
ncbi:hypothetical protein Tco_0013825 [Tanacetum coccineum]